MTLFWRTSPPGPTRARAGLFIGCALALASAHAQSSDALGAADPARARVGPGGDVRQKRVMEIS